MYFDDIEWETLTDEQLRLEDKAALTLTKKNCLVLAKLLRAGEIQKYPKPHLLRNDYFHIIWDNTNYPDTHCTRLSILLKQAVYVADYKLQVDPQGLVNVAYFFACNGYLIEIGKGDDDWFASFTRWLTGWFGPFVDERDKLGLQSKEVLNFNKVKRAAVAADPTKLSLLDLDATTISEGSEFPEDLARHLAGFNSIDSLISEACRIMMLGPKYKRAEDAMSSLLDAWETMKKL